MKRAVLACLLASMLLLGCCCAASPSGWSSCTSDSECAAYCQSRGYSDGWCSVGECECE